MELQINQAFAPTDRPFVATGGVTVCLSPPLDQDYWLARVVLGDNAIVCFPKFFTIGIGFQHEADDWNTNLPYTSDAVEIWDHIKHNKGDKSITREAGIAAIRVVQEYARSLDIKP